MCFSSSKQPGPGHLAAPPGQALKPADLTSLRCSILASSAYVSLSLGDNVTTLEFTKLLLAQTRLPGSLKYVAPPQVNFVCIDRIQYDVTVQIFALQDGVCRRVCVGVRVCAIEIKPGMLRAACFFDVHM